MAMAARSNHRVFLDDANDVDDSDVIYSELPLITQQIPHHIQPEPVVYTPEDVYNVNLSEFITVQVKTSRTGQGYLRFIRTNGGSYKGSLFLDAFLQLKDIKNDIQTELYKVLKSQQNSISSSRSHHHQHCQQPEQQKLTLPDAVHYEHVLTVNKIGQPLKVLLSTYKGKIYAGFQKFLSTGQRIYGGGFNLYFTEFKTLLLNLDYLEVLICEKTVKNDERCEHYADGESNYSINSLTGYSRQSASH